MNMLPHSALILTLILAKGNAMVTRTEAEGGTMPTFEESACPDNVGEMCLKVVFPNKVMDFLILTSMPKTSIYEGFLQGDKDVSVVMIDTPMTKKRMINFNSENVPRCSYFDIDLTTNTVKCVRAGFNVTDSKAEKNLTKKANGCCNSASECCEGPIVPLQSYFGSGIPVRVLFTFDSSFYNEFDGKDGKPADEHMDAVVAIVKNAYTDKSLKNAIGTTVNIIGTTKMYNGELPALSFTDLSGVGKLVEDEDEYDVFSFITRRTWGPGGVAYGAQVCEDGNWAINLNYAYGPNNCNAFQPPEAIECTPSNRIVLTAETVAHEIGHNLGMAHDFVSENPYVYRKFENEDCRGLMDYIDDGIGWSKCSSRDFSRYITSGGTKDPCLKVVDEATTARTTLTTHAATTEVSTTETPNVCEGNEFRCDGGKCIPDYWKCDNIFDCEDGTDESDDTCPKVSTTENPYVCEGNEFRCDGGKCIPNYWKCDKINDCEDGTDESDDTCLKVSTTGNPYVCEGNEFRCDGGKCIPDYWKCDNYDDCEDKTDESDDTCLKVSTTENPHVCEGNEFLCDGGKCIPDYWMCDKIDDCDDGTDESENTCPCSKPFSEFRSCK